MEISKEISDPQKVGERPAIMSGDKEIMSQIRKHTNKAVIKFKGHNCWYRYVLLREWDDSKSILGVIMLNPSIADDKIDDPTIRRVCGFADTWGYGGIMVGNLYAAVSTKPNELKKLAYPIGMLNNIYLKRIRKKCKDVIAGWGIKAEKSRVQEVIKFMRPLLAFRLTKDGHPSHPLYLPKDIKPVIYIK